MYKHLSSMKIPKLLAFSLALSLTPVCAAAEVQPPQAAAEAKTAAEEILSHEPAEESAGEVPTHYSLNFDKEAFRKETAEVAGLPINFRVYENCRYTAYPAASEKEQLSIYVPEEYFSKKKVNGFTARTAPVLVPLTLRDTTGETSLSPEDCQQLALQALAHGYVVVVPNALDLVSAENERLGKAPLYLLEAKAAIRYLRRNHHRLPAGDLSRIVVTGQGLAGSLALQLAASTDQENYHPYLRGLGAAERSDHVFAAQAYEPDLSLAKDATRFGWILPDGRPDPYAVSRYVPLIDLDAALDRSLNSPHTDTALLEMLLPPEETTEEVTKTMDGTIEKAAENSSALTAEKDSTAKEKDSLTTDKDSSAEEKDSLTTEKDSTGREKGSFTTEKDSTAKEKTAEPVKKPLKIIYDTKEYRDSLAKKAIYEEAKEAYETFVSEHAPLTQNANYLRLYSSSENNLGESFEKTGTCVAVLSQPVSLPQDLHDLFSWIDEADLLQDELDEELAKQLKKEREKLARAKLLYDRANVRARKKQAKLERQARRNGGIVPYDIVTPTEKK